MIQIGKNRKFRTISYIIGDSEMAQSVNTFPEFNILGSYKFYSKEWKMSVKLCTKAPSSFVP